MKNPDQIVYDTEKGYNANLLPYGTSVGAPKIELDQVDLWKSSSVKKVNHQFKTKFDQLKSAYQELLSEVEINHLLYSARYSFEPIVGEVYHLYKEADEQHFLSIISPDQWNKNHVGSFALNTDKVWEPVEVN